MVTAAGPSMPQAQFLKYHHVPTMIAMIKAKQMVLVRCVKRRDLKMKWSKRTPDIKTENHRVGSCRPARSVSSSPGGRAPRDLTYVVVQISDAALWTNELLVSTLAKSQRLHKSLTPYHDQERN